jgi:predicted RNA binding protein YcfA (HicA-like mRNA interferase family)
MLSSWLFSWKIFVPLPDTSLRMKVSEVIKLLEKDGWFLARQTGSHRQYKHQTKTGLVTLAVHRLSDDLAPGTLNSILKQAGLKNQ